MLQAEDEFESNKLPISRVSNDIVVNVYQYPYRCHRDHKRSRDNDTLQKEATITKEYE
jgi:hypothetical protein